MQNPLLLYDVVFISKHYRGNASNLSWWNALINMMHTNEQCIQSSILCLIFFKGVLAKETNMSLWLLSVKAFSIKLRTATHA